MQMHWVAVARDQKGVVRGGQGCMGRAGGKEVVVTEQVPKHACRAQK